MIFRFALIMLGAVLLAGCRGDSEAWYSVKDFADVPKADVHVHIFTDNPAFMEQARRDNFRVLNMAVDLNNSLAEVRSQWAFLKVQRSLAPDFVENITAFSMEGFEDEGWLDQSIAWLDSCFAEGALGIKVWKNIGMSYRDGAGKLVMIDDPRLDPIFDLMEERGIPVLGHLGEPKNCWLPLEEMTTNNDRTYFARNPQYHMHLHPEFPSYEEQVAARDRRLEAHPDLSFLAVHMASVEWDVDELAARLDRFPNMTIDLAARMGQVFYQTHHDREKVRNFFIKYQDRILYGTDLYATGDEDSEVLWKEMHDTWMRDWRFFVTDDSLTSSLVNESYRGLKLPRQVVDKIYLQNAQRSLKAFLSNDERTK
jgi:predicted TIM-barrel fold metal-dependent hydrolase